MFVDPVVHLSQDYVHNFCPLVLQRSRRCLSDDTSAAICWVFVTTNGYFPRSLMLISERMWMALQAWLTMPSLLAFVTMTWKGKNLDRGAKSFLQDDQTRYLTTNSTAVQV